MITKNDVDLSIAEYHTKPFLTIREQYILSGLEVLSLIMEDSKKEEYITLYDVFSKYEGTKEYDGIVSVIQKWYYGKVVKSAWCVTAVMWAIAQLGLKRYTFGEDNTDNVFYFNDLCYYAKTKGRLEFVPIYSMKKGDIVILCFDKTFTPTSSKHVTIACGEQNTKTFIGIGGNQSNMIRKTEYKNDDIVYIWRPHYEKETVRKVELLPNG